MSFMRGFKCGGNDRTKVKVAICVLAGLERSGWVCPQLVNNLLTLVKDDRFDVHVHVMLAHSPVSYARNLSIVQAREQKAEWLLMIDNDQHFWTHTQPLDVLSAAGLGKEIIGFISMQGQKFGGYENGDMFIPNIRTLEPHDVDGDFFTVARVGTGAMFIHHSVWESIAGPWFKEQIDPKSELGAVDEETPGEDFYFCDLVRQHGFKVWAHAAIIPHLKTTEIATVGAQLKTLKQMAGQTNARPPAKLEWK